MQNLLVRLGIAAGLTAALAASAAAQDPAQTPMEKPAGSALFASYCATCHGTSATGDGPLAAMLRKPPANLTLLARRNGGVFSPQMVERIIDGRHPLGGHGGGDMPVWGDAFGRTTDGPEKISAKIAALAEYPGIDATEMKRSARATSGGGRSSDRVRSRRVRAGPVCGRGTPGTLLLPERA